MAYASGSNTWPECVLKTLHWHVLERSETSTRRKAQIYWNVLKTQGYTETLKNPFIVGFRGVSNNRDVFLKYYRVKINSCVCVCQYASLNCVCVNSLDTNSPSGTEISANLKQTYFSFSCYGVFFYLYWTVVKLYLVLSKETLLTQTLFQYLDQQRVRHSGWTQHNKDCDPAEKTTGVLNSNHGASP